MARKRGTVTNYKRPEWQPLLDLVGEEVTGDFMWMHEVTLSDGTAVHAYKHWHTRQYVHLSEEGETFVFEAPDFYREIDPVVLLMVVFADLPALVGGTEQRIQASREAVERLEVRLEAAGD